MNILKNIRKVVLSTKTDVCTLLVQCPFARVAAATAYVYEIYLKGSKLVLNGNEMKSTWFFSLFLVIVLLSFKSIRKIDDVKML